MKELQIYTFLNLILTKISFNNANDTNTNYQLDKLLNKQKYSLYKINNSNIEIPPILEAKISIWDIHPSQLQSDGFHSCQIRYTTRKLECWGSNMYDQVQVPLSLSSDVIKFAVGSGHSCALSKDQILICFGLNVDKQCDVPALFESDIVLISLGEEHSCVLNNRLQLGCWGDNSSGQSDIPDFISDNTISLIVAGGNHNCVQFRPNSDAALSAEARNNELRCWGFDKVGQTRIPEDILLSIKHSPIKQLVAGSGHTCSLLASSKLFCWGWNEQGQLDFIQGMMIRLVVWVAAGWEFNCVLQMAGKPQCWGKGDQGQLEVPEAPGLTSWAGVSGGSDHSCGLLDNGKVLCWGLNDRHQCEVTRYKY